MTKILVVSDIHGSENGAKVIHDFIKSLEPDILAICGDLTHFGPSKWAHIFLETIDIPTLVVNGNCDPDDMVESIKNSKAISIIDSIEEIKGLTFLGIGYPWSKISMNDIKYIDVVLSHEPPYGYNDYSSDVGHLGNQELLALIRKIKPRLCLSGHIHESKGIVEDEGTIFVNPGPAKDGFGALVDIGDNIKTQLL